MLIRPRINWRKIIINVIMVFIIDFILTICSSKIFNVLGIESRTKNIFKIVKWIYCIPCNNYFMQIFLFYLFCSIIINLKKIMIFFVKLYQRYASESTRKLCLFKPSCSEYMILSIEKYGCIRGFIKGIKRLRRCHTPNGGIDYP